MFKSLIFILFSISCLSLMASDNIQNFSYGKVNWSKKIIIVTGSGAPNINSKTASPSQARLTAERAAKLDAYRNALEVIKGLKIKSNLTIEEEMSSNKVISTKVQGIIRGGKEKGKKYYDDGGVDIILEIPLSGILPLKNYTNKKEALPTSGKEKKYTSLVVNLLNFKYKKVLHPVVKDESNKLVYSVNMLSKEESSIVHYFKNMDDAKKLMGDSPLIVEAKSLSKKDKSTVIISDIDSKKLIDGSTDLSFLKEAKVIFITK